jgi:hypothetical protein
MTDQETFEAALVREYDGKRLFRDLVVYPIELDEGDGPELKHFVTGQYFNGKPTKVGGRWEAKWEPYCFVAGTPFVPQSDGEALDPATRHDQAVARAARRQAQQKPGRDADGDFDPEEAAATQAAASADATVLDYLARMGRERGVRYTYAWWLHPRWQLAVWMAGSFLLIGLVWPTFVNVMAFGTLRRPPEESTGPGWRETLRGVFGKRRLAIASPRPATANGADVREYDAALEAQLAARGAGEPDPIAAIGPDLPPEAPPVLAAAPETAAVPDGPHEEHHYEAKRDDFYPTEKKPVHHR